MKTKNNITANKLVKSLEGIVGKEFISTKNIDLLAYMNTQAPGSDFDRFSKKVTGVVVLPETTEQVSSILKFANKKGTPVVARGGGTSQFGGNLPLNNGILIDMSRMDRILSIDEKNMVVVAEGGASVYDIMRSCNQKGLRFPISPVFTAGPQIGACVSTNMTGDFINRTGRLGESLVGLEVVLPTGDVVTLGSGAYSSGYGHYHRYMGGPDVMGIFVNAAGTMGVYTKVAVRLLIKPKFECFFSYAWPRSKINDLTEAMVEMQNHGIYDIHLFNEWTLYPGVKAGFITLPKDAHFIPLLAQDGDTQEELDIRVKAMRDICIKYGGIECDEINQNVMGPPNYVFHNPPNTGTSTWARTATTFWYNPVRAFPEVYGFWEECTKKYGFWGEKYCPAWLSWADRNSMNPYPLTGFYNPVDKEELKRFEAYWRDLHLGLTKLGCVQYVYGPNLPKEVLEELGPAYELMKKVKKLIDPKNIMNPGVLF